MQVALKDRLQGSGNDRDTSLFKALSLCERFLRNANGTEAEFEVLKSLVQQELSAKVCLPNHCASVLCTRHRGSGSHLEHVERAVNKRGQAVKQSEPS